MKIFIILCLLFVTPIVDADPKISVFFSPGTSESTKAWQALNTVIEQTKTRLYAAVYVLTDARISNALIQAKERGVEIILIVDRASVSSPYSQTRKLDAAGIKVFVYNTPPATKQNPFGGLMHNKIAICDKTVATGSFNWTNSGSYWNRENLLIITDEALAESYLIEFEDIKQNSTALADYLEANNITTKNFNPNKQKAGTSYWSRIKTWFDGWDFTRLSSRRAKRA